ncbi:MAG: alpha/beta hydrolase [Candidatus Longimicrobiales bacterium M2_2A_002]
MSWERVAIGMAVVAAVAVLLVVLWPVARHRLIYPGGTLAPDRSDPASHGLPHGEEVWLQAEDGVRVHAWWVPASPARGNADGRGAILYCHGNAETMATRAWIADRLSRLGYPALLFDYRGYGLSEGRASEEGLARDARAAWRYMVEVQAVPPGRIVLMGHSLGSAVATRLALEVQNDDAGENDVDGGPVSRTGSTAVPAGLVVGAPFPDMPAVFAHHAPWLPDRALRWRTDRLDAGSRMDDVRGPVLIVIGAGDDVIPPELSRAVYQAAADRAVGGSVERVTVRAEHGELMGHPDVWTALERFLDRVLPEE